VNEPPILEAGGYPTGLPLSESTKVGTEVFVLKGHDPEGSPVKYGIQLTDHFVVNPRTGVITLAKPLNREVKYNIIWFRRATFLSKRGTCTQIVLIWTTDVHPILAIFLTRAISYARLYRRRLSLTICFFIFICLVPHLKPLSPSLPFFISLNIM